MSAPALVACAVAALALAVPVVAATASLEAAHRAHGAADAAALAAADAAAGWVEAEPCPLAERVVVAAGASLDECRIDDRSGIVHVRVSLATALGPVHARARAGPPVP
jgi:secretion/DNA translocation related TadE-like protein